MNTRKRCFDLILLVLLSPLIIVTSGIITLILLLSSQPILFWSERAGRESKSFQMPKFSTMRKDAPNVPTENLKNPSNWITPLGRVLRKTSLDELPQFWCVLKGQMSLVGPRPMMLTKKYLIDERKRYGIDTIRPGITGWAQVNGRDTISDEKKIQFEMEYLQKMSIFFDAKILIITLVKVFRCSDVSH